MVKFITIYVEGAGLKYADIAFRKAFKTFLMEFDTILRERGGKLETIPCGTRRLAYDKFCHALKQRQPHTLLLLLVDSESEVKQVGECWKHVKEREGDKWKKPAGAEEWQCHFMAQAMEAWFFADPDALEKFYRHNNNKVEFNKNSLPHHSNVEDVSKENHIAALESVTKGTTKGRYHKIQHGPKILETLDNAKVRDRAPHCERLFAVLEEKINANA